MDELAIKELHHEEGLKALRPARELLERERVPHVVHIGVGDLAHVITHYAKELRSREVYLTDTERSEGSALSTAIAELHPITEVPVTAVK